MSNDLSSHDDLCRLIRGEPIDAVIKPEPQPEQPKRSLLARMFRAEPKPAEPDTPFAVLGRFRKEISAAIDKALDARVDRRSLADVLEDSAVAQRGAWSLSAPL
jgi:hypothetical protein